MKASPISENNSKMAVICLPVWIISLKKQAMMSPLNLDIYIAFNCYDNLKYKVELACRSLK